MFNLVGLILLITSGLVYVFRAFPEDQFLMIIELSEYQLEIKSAFVFSSIILLIIAISFIVYFIVRFLTFYKNSNYRSVIKNHQQSQLVLSDFMKNLFLRDVAKSQKNINQLKRYIDNKSYLYRFLHLQNLMISNDDKKIRSALLAMNHDYPNDVFILNSLGLDFYKHHDYETSINYLERSVNIDFKSRNTIDVLVANYQICSEVNKLENLIKRAISKKLISKNEYKKERALNYLAMALEHYKTKDLKNYHKYSEIAFDSYNGHQYIFNNYINSLLLKKKDSKAINLIISSWETLAHPMLREYLITLLKDKSHKCQLKIARELIDRNNYSVESFLVFGYLTKDDISLDDEAIKYLERAMNIAKIKEVIDLLIAIKSKYYPDTDSEIIELKRSKERIDCEYKYSCSDCGQYVDNWQLICHECHSIDQIDIGLENKNKVSLLENS